mmetsp:Transcript_117685/g.214012  ORF Transcript_117685/g.214012 Transcript_117685/m.214012 type:complete len:123 (-) Transcript_117685:267-635(-)
MKSARRTATGVITNIITEMITNIIIIVEQTVIHITEMTLVSRTVAGIARMITNESADTARCMTKQGPTQSHWVGMFTVKGCPRTLRCRRRRSSQNEASKKPRKAANTGMIHNISRRCSSTNS